MREGIETVDEKLSQCSDCGAVLTYKGLGEYFCPVCEKTVYNDYGKVRNYLEAHPGATIADVSYATSVPKGIIRHFLDEERFYESTRRALDG